MGAVHNYMIYESQTGHTQHEKRFYAQVIKIAQTKGFCSVFGSGRDLGHVRLHTCPYMAGRYSRRLDVSLPGRGIGEGSKKPPLKPHGLAPGFRLPFLLFPPGAAARGCNSLQCGQMRIPRCPAWPISTWGWGQIHGSARQLCRPASMICWL